MSLPPIQVTMTSNYANVVLTGIYEASKMRIVNLRYITKTLGNQNLYIIIENFDKIIPVNSTGLNTNLSFVLPLFSAVNTDMLYLDDGIDKIVLNKPTSFKSFKVTAFVDNINNADISGSNPLHFQILFN